MDTREETLRRNIRALRKARGMTLEALGLAIHKSKATVSKYETGALVLDVDTLYRIADALQLPPSRLMERLLPEQRPLEATGGNEERLYLYFFDGRNNAIARSYIAISPTESNGSYTAAMFYRVRSFAAVEECDYLYYGSATRGDSFLSFSFVNQNSRAERLFIVAREPFRRGDCIFGLLSGICDETLLPVCIKVALSHAPLNENGVLLGMLHITPQEQKLLKKTNRLTVR